jgi:hypothetical protein
MNPSFEKGGLGGFMKKIFPVVKCGGLVKSQKCSRIVIPVKTGIQRFQCVTQTL